MYDLITNVYIKASQYINLGEGKNIIDCIITVSLENIDIYNITTGLRYSLVCKINSFTMFNVILINDILVISFD